MKRQPRNSGFSAVELLITLFVAAAFIITGFQLYLSIVKDSGDTNQTARASAKLIEYLQQYKTYAQEPCVPSKPVAETAISVAGLANVTISVQITCISSAQSTSKITAIIKYGNPQRTLIDSTYTAPNCPTGFISVPGSATYGTSNFCVMKYEAKQIGSIPVSQASGTPWVNITQVNAISAAQSACVGCHLITEAEYLTIAQNVLSVASNWDNGAGVHTVGTGYIYSGNNNNDSDNNVLAADTNDANGYYGTNNSSGNQRRTLTLTNGEVIWDLAGNVWEWTSGTVQSPTVQPGITGTGGNWREWTAVTNPGTISPNPSPAATGITGASGWNSGNGIGQIYSNTEETGLRGFLRGGDCGIASNPGVLTLRLNYAPGYAYTSVGFRVAK